jgi:arylsulfatase A-like enzyme
VRDLAGLVDVMPTMLTAAGVNVPPAAQGRDLLSTKPPAALYAEEDHEGNVLESIRTSDWKLIQANEGNPRGLDPLELYYLADDPRETRNLAGSRTDRLASLTAQLKRLREAAKSSEVTAVHGELDDTEKARLKALGYMDENE